MANGSGTDHPWGGEERRARTNGSALERHITAGVAAVMLALLGWVGFSMIDLGKEQVKTTTQLTQVRDDMRNLQDQYIRGTADRYTASEARRDLAIVNAAMQRLDERIERVERAERKR